jgi:hypothetical protein
VLPTVIRSRITNPHKLPLDDCMFSNSIRTPLTCGGTLTNYVSTPLNCIRTLSNCTHTLLNCTCTLSNCMQMLPNCKRVRSNYIAKNLNKTAHIFAICR